MLSWLNSPPQKLPDRLTFGDITVPLVVSRHPKARQLTLRFCPNRRTIRLTLPKRAALKHAASFLAKRHGWLAEQVRAYPHAVPYAHGMALPVLGEMLRIHHEEALRGRVVREGDCLTVHAPLEHWDSRLETWLKTALRKVILEEAYPMAETLGVSFKKLSVRETASRWGSCSSSGNLSFCWRLVFAPAHIRRYVVAHEIAHLEEMNHSPAFWALVAKLDPAYKTHRKWLKDNTGELHRYGQGNGLIEG